MTKIPAAPTRWYRASLFPIALLIAVCILSLLEVHGSSIGLYNRFFYGEGHPDKNLLYGEPRLIRSDEWMISTPMTLSQVNNEFRTINPDIGLGQDMSVLLDVPQKDWALLFEPRNWAYFVLPVEKAFAFKWWLLGFLLMISCYVFTLTLLPGRYLTAILLSLTLFFAPYVQWWYQAGTLAPIYYAFLLLTVMIKLAEAKAERRRILLAAAMSYLLVCLALVQYLPFLLTGGLTIGIFMVGFLLDRRHSGSGNRVRGDALRTVAYAGGAMSVAGGVVGLFVITRLEVWRTILRTEYPGKRQPEAPAASLGNVLAGFLSNSLQDTQKASHYFANQSEAASFILLAPFLLIPSAYLLYRTFRNRSALGYALVLVNLLLVLFLARSLISIRGASTFASAIRVVPHFRVMLALGLVSFLQLILLARDQRSETYPPLLRWTSVALVFLALLLIGFYVRATYPGYVHHILKIVGLAALVALAFHFFLNQRVAASLALLLLVSLYSSYRVNPLYRGLDPLTDSALAKKLRMVDGQRPGRWIVLEDGEYGTYLSALGIGSYSGVYVYPQLELWERLDPKGQYRHVYNRYALAWFSAAPAEQFTLLVPVVFEVKFEACDQFVQRSASHVLAPGPVDSPCLTLVETVPYPQKRFHVYAVRPAGGGAVSVAGR